MRILVVSRWKLSDLSKRLWNIFLFPLIGSWLAVKFLQRPLYSLNWSDDCPISLPFHLKTTWSPPKSPNPPLRSINNAIISQLHVSPSSLETTIENESSQVLIAMRFSKTRHNHIHAKNNYKRLWSRLKSCTAPLWNKNDRRTLYTAYRQQQ